MELTNHPALAGCRPSTRTVWLLLLIRMHNDGWCIPRVRWLAERAGCTRETARIALQDLEARGLVLRSARHQRKRRTTNHVRLGPVARGLMAAGGEGHIPIGVALAALERG